MTDLVTGGGGFIGRHVVDALTREGRQVRVLDVVPGSGFAEGVEIIAGSVTDPAAVRRAMAGVERVFHVAGIASLWIRNKADYDAVNHRATEIVLQAAAAADVERVVHTSTGAILFYPLHHRAPTDLPRLQDMPGPYCRSKFLAEEACMAAARRGQHVVIVNPTLPLGPGDRSCTPPTRMIRDFLNGDTPAFVEFPASLVDVRDVALGHLQAAAVGRPGRRYFLGNPPVPLSRVLALLADVSGATMPRVKVPYPVALAAGAVSELTADLITGKAPKAPLTGVRLTRRPVAPLLARPLSELGVPLRPISDTLTDTVAWLVAEGHIRRSMPRLS